MKVVISVGGKFHAMHLAKRLAERGMLERLITTKQWYAKDIPSGKVKALPIPEVDLRAILGDTARELFQIQ